MTKSDGGSVKCPECGNAASGNFCNQCGANLGGRFCDQCGAQLSGGAKFCNQCGQKAGAGGRTRPVTPEHKAAAAEVVGGQNLPWWIAGFAMFGLILVVGTQMVRSGSAGPEVTPPATTGPASGAAAVDLSSMTPVQAADRLFDRIMRATSAGDSAEAQAFMPMALDAYELAKPLNNDGLFHLALLQRTGFRLEESLASAQEILASDPDHLLGLAAAAEACIELGRMDEAATYYRRVVEVYDAEMAAPEQEYLDHSLLTESLKTNAEAFLAGR